MKYFNQNATKSIFNSISKNSNEIYRAEMLKNG